MSKVLGPNFSSALAVINEETWIRIRFAILINVCSVTASFSEKFKIFEWSMSSGGLRLENVAWILKTPVDAPYILSKHVD